MIVVPVKTNNTNPAVSPLFGKAKWFAFVDNGEIKIEQNMCEGGRAVVEWLRSKGMNKLIIQEMGNNPYNKIKEYDNVTIYHSGFDRITLDEVVEKLHNGELKKLDDEAMQIILAQHDGRHNHNHGDDHNHHHNH